MRRPPTPAGRGRAHLAREGPWLPLPPWGGVCPLRAGGTCGVPLPPGGTVPTSRTGRAGPRWGAGSSPWRDPRAVRLPPGGGVPATCGRGLRLPLPTGRGCAPFRHRVGRLPVVGGAGSSPEGTGGEPPAPGRRTSGLPALRSRARRPPHPAPDDRPEHNKPVRRLRTDPAPTENLTRKPTAPARARCRGPAPEPPRLNRRRGWILPPAPQTPEGLTFRHPTGLDCARADLPQRGAPPRG